MSFRALVTYTTLPHPARFRRILVRWETLGETYIAMLHLALGIITWRAAGPLK